MKQKINVNEVLREDGESGSIVIIENDDDDDDDNDLVVSKQKTNITSLSEEVEVDIYSVAGLFTLFFRELPEPLLTYSLYGYWIHCIDSG